MKRHCVICEKPIQKYSIYVEAHFLGLVFHAHKGCINKESTNGEFQYIYNNGDKENK